MAKQQWRTDPREALKAGPDFDLAAFDRNGQPGWEGDRDGGEEYMARRGEEMSELQERLFAEGRSGGNRSVLLVLQGLDTAGKGGIVRHVMGMVDPQGVKLASFGVPTPEEREHHYLWRIEKQLPPPGRIGVFDRSHYEDVLVVRVDELVPREVWSGRYDEINAWEQKVIESGTTLVKVALMVSYDEQGARLMERLERPDKYWKFSPGDIDTRSKWPAFQEAYADVFARTSTEQAPWYVVPADKKWYARLAVTEILTRTLEDLDPTWPPATFDVAEMRAALQETIDHPA
ncbi:polyphosphate kinase 2 family protein [Propioniciclava coleopterorum]|uniref:Polyphosphate kinase 2 family protein n=1 Tax=Propioniciclava coleopterorum TaxID=2714937 RepID=A0A6G7Y3E9_9ACTN|nr:PPK2 family polyphosphate kinase [Propioniciclava coleopterorum]QIK71137.1 polyphosphate kinase 2 family protein [Propioniciclava coleopterorum]